MSNCFARSRIVSCRFISARPTDSVSSSVSVPPPSGGSPDARAADGSARRASAPASAPRGGPRRDWRSIAAAAPRPRLDLLADRLDLFVAAGAATRRHARRLPLLRPPPSARLRLCRLRAPTVRAARRFTEVRRERERRERPVTARAETHGGELAADQTIARRRCASIDQVIQRARTRASGVDTRSAATAAAGLLESSEAAGGDATAARPRAADTLSPTQPRADSRLAPRGPASRDSAHVNWTRPRTSESASAARRDLECLLDPSSAPRAASRANRQRWPAPPDPADVAAGARRWRMPAAHGAAPAPAMPRRAVRGDVDARDDTHAERAAGVPARRPARRRARHTYAHSVVPACEAGRDRRRTAAPTTGRRRDRRSRARGSDPRSASRPWPAGCRSDRAATPPRRRQCAGDRLAQVAGAAARGRPARGFGPPRLERRRSAAAAARSCVRRRPAAHAARPRPLCDEVVGRPRSGERQRSAPARQGVAPRFAPP